MIGIQKVAVAAMTALTLGLGGLASATPVLAQGFEFNFGFGGDGGGKAFQPRRFCVLTDRGLRDAIEDQGYDDVFLNVPIERHVQARATRGDWVYLLKVDICNGDIVDRERLRRS
jgi:hypothetical protein